MDKTIRWNVDPKEQQAETYRYWQNVSVAERLGATSELSIDVYGLKANVNAAQRLLKNKLESGRPRDLLDIEAIREAAPTQG
jgi:hypothetical protein